MKKSEIERQLHYKKIANIFGVSGKSTLKDQTLRALEGKFLIEQIKLFQEKNDHPLKILDLGHGNGQTLAMLTNYFPQHEFFGLEICPELYELSAHRTEIKTKNVFHGDMLKPFPIDMSFDVIFTQRSLINLLSFDEQKLAVKNIAKSLSPGGLYLMIESFEKPWQLLNKFRREHQLPELPMSSQNIYLKSSIIKYLVDLKFFEISVSGQQCDHHFFLTRILHPIFRKSGDKVEDSLFVNYLQDWPNQSSLQISPLRFRAFHRKWFHQDLDKND